MAEKTKIPSCEDLAKSNPSVDLETLGDYLSLIQDLRKSGVKRHEYDLIGPREARLRAEPSTYATKRAHKK